MLSGQHALRAAFYHMLSGQHALGAAFHQMLSGQHRYIVAWEIGPVVPVLSGSFYIIFRQDVVSVG